MADFCRQCSISIFGEDMKDLADMTTTVTLVLCEGCGMIHVMESIDQNIAIDAIKRLTGIPREEPSHLNTIVKVESKRQVVTGNRYPGCGPGYVEKVESEK